jgi:DNA polymerase-4
VWPLFPLDPRPCQYQGDLFERPDEAREHLHRVVDAINGRFGELTIAPGKLVNRSPTPNVISPAWKPRGPRQTIECERQGIPDGLVDGRKRR